MDEGSSQSMASVSGRLRSTAPIGSSSISGSETAPNRDQDFAVERLAKGGHPVVRIDLRDPYDVGQEFFRWEIATAVAGSIFGINQFNQPDVEVSKVATRTLTEAYEASGSLPAETPFVEDDGFTLFTDEVNVAALKVTAGGLDRGSGPQSASGSPLFGQLLLRCSRTSR